MNDQIITAIKEEFAPYVPDGYTNEDIHIKGGIVLVLDFDYERRSDSPTTNLNASIDGRDCTKTELTIIKDTLNAI